MKRFLLAVVATSIISCGDRKTQNEKGETDLNENTEIVDDASMYQTTEDTKKKNVDIKEIQEGKDAKTVINDYFDAIRRSKTREAYDIMAPESNRGTFSSFSENNMKFDQISVSFTDKPQVTDNGSSITVKIPLKYSGTTKQGNEETYKGVATLKREKEDKSDSNTNGNYKIINLDVARENG